MTFASHANLRAVSGAIRESPWEEPTTVAAPTRAARSSYDIVSINVVFTPDGGRSPALVARRHTSMSACPRRVWGLRVSRSPSGPGTGADRGPIAASNAAAPAGSNINW
jgi:hypothetical protein